MIDALVQLELVQGQQKLWRYLARWGLALWCAAIALLLAGVAGKLELPQEAFFRWAYEPLSPGFFGLWGVLLFEHAVLLHLGLLLVVLPALAVASLTTEKTTGSLTLLLTTSLDGRHIVVGKLLAQAIRIGELLLVTWPWVALSLPLFGAQPGPMLALLLAEVALLFGIGSLGLLVGTWRRTTTSGILTTYAVLAGLVLLGESGLVPGLSPLWLLWGIWEPVTPVRVFALVGIWAAIGVVSLLLAAWRLRPAWAAQLGAGSRRSDRSRTHPEMVGSPMRWKERNCGWGMPWWWPAWLTRTAVVVASIAGAWTVTGPASENRFYLGSVLTVLAFGLIVQVRTAVTIGGERENQTWDLLRLTLLTPESLVRGKLWGTLDIVFPLVTFALIPAGVVACRSGPWSVAAVVVVWLAAWPILYALAACGLRSSAGTRSSWWGLLSCLCSSLMIYLVRLLPLTFLWYIVFLIGLAFLIGLTYLGVPYVQGRLVMSYILSWKLLEVAVIGYLSFDVAEDLIQEAAQNLTRADDDDDDADAGHSSEIARPPIVDQ